MLSEMVYNPVKAQKYKQSKSPLCWRGCNHKGTMTHIWWEYTKIKEYCQDIQCYIREITGKETPNDPCVCVLLQIVQKNKYKRTLTPYLLNAVKEIIPKKNG